MVMETYPHLVSSQIPHILLYTFIQYKIKNNHCVIFYTVKTLAAGIILPINNIIRNKCSQEIDIGLNPGPVFL
jgi:hypothetical protein